MTALFSKPNARIAVTGVMLELFGIFSIIFIVMWTYGYISRASFNASINTQLVTFHAIVMPTALIFLSGNGYDSQQVKLLHYFLEGSAMVLMIFGYIAINNARFTMAENFYSLHSWFGVIVIAIFFIEFISGIFFLNIKNVSERAHSIAFDFHSFFGLFNCIMAVWTGCLGITTLMSRYILIFNQFKTPHLLANLSGLCMVFFGSLVFLICVDPSYEWDKEEENKPE